MNTPGTQPLIVGLSCRLPGARGVSDVWKVLSEGRCTVGQVDNRLFDPNLYFDLHRPRRGKSYSFAAGQLDDLYHFDANFFGISPRAANEMDPQQRLMLQSVWEAVEDSGLNIADLAGDRTGVFVGASLVEMLPKYYLDPARGGSNFVLGNTLSIIANRVSSVFDFGGPSYVLDTACSSGLYALHQASDAIASGAIDTAIVGGVHVVRTPGGFVGFSQARMLSPTGLCRAFDASADGYVRSEACVTVILMHPDKVNALDPRIRGRLIAIGVNSDGAAQQLTVPSAARQELLLGRVLASSGRDPEEVDYYEAHGTGTQVGDLAEATALGETIGSLRRIPLSIGSAKTNFGHAEPAAGLVGLAKVLLAMEHRSVPKSLHCPNPNPAIDFESLNLRVLDCAQELRQHEKVLAGISSFGFGGTNVAALIESPDQIPRNVHPVAALPNRPWLRLSAESEASLKRLRLLWADRLEATTPEQWSSLAKAAARRSSLTHRCAFSMSDEVPDLLRRRAPKGLVSDQIAFRKARTVFTFPGNGAQHPEMGRIAYACDTVYRAAFDAVALAFAGAGFENLTKHLNSDNLEALLQSPQVAQPILFACQVAQAKTLEKAGVIPDALLGHSLGEIAALHLAGAFDLENAALIVMRRSARFEALRGKGGMLAVAASEADVRRMLGGFDDTLEIAAINSPLSVVVSGPLSMLERFAKATLNGKRVAMARLGVEVAYHSAALDSFEDDFRDDLSDIVFEKLAIPVAGAAVGRMLRKTEVDAEYLWRNARRSVQFQNAVEDLAKEHPCSFIEIAPKPVLASNIRDIVRFSGLSAYHCIPPEPDADRERFEAACWVKGLTIHQTKKEQMAAQPAIPLPSYPWDEQEYFQPMSPDARDYWGEFGAPTLAGLRVDRDAAVWISEFTPTQPAWVADHVVGNATILPATALLEIALSAGAALWPDVALELSEFDILQPADLGKDGLSIRTTIDDVTGCVTLSMRPRLAESEWALLARATLQHASAKISKAWPRNLAWDDLPTGFYDRLSSAGLRYGPHFQVLEATASRGKARIYSQLGDYGQGLEICLDPMKVDAAFHSLAIWDKGPASQLQKTLETGAVLVPNRVGKLIWNGVHKPVRFACLEVTAMRARSIGVTLTLFDETGCVIAQLQSVELAMVPTASSNKPYPKFWRRRKPRWRAPDATVRWPRGWSKPGKVFERLGLTKTPSYSPGQDFLVEMRRALHAGPPGNDRLQEMLSKAPNFANDVRDLLVRHAGKPNFGITQTSASHRAIWKVAERLVGELSASWRPRERLNIAVLGLVDPVIVTRWTEAREIDDVFLSACNEAQYDHLTGSLRANLLPRLHSKIRQGSADLVVVIDGDIDDESINEFAAPNAIVLRLDTDQPDKSKVDFGTWFTKSDELCVRVRVGEAGLAQAVPDVLLSKNADETWPSSTLGEMADQPGLETLVHRHLEEEDASASLARLLLQLKSYYALENRPRILLIWNEGAANFGAFAQTIGTILRSLRNEVPDWAVSAIVVEKAPPETLWKALLNAAMREPVLHVCTGDVRTERVEAAPALHPKGSNAALCVPAVIGRELTWRAAPRPKPLAGEVEIEVAATGLNFRDVLWVQGRIPDWLFDVGASPASMGLECSGLVTRVGPGVEIPVGQPVMTFAADAFRHRLVTQASNVFPVPKGLSLTAAASIPVAFATAWESLNRLATLKTGESVLIHGAAGGVGMAAIQVAQLLGARVLATAGTADKRAMVRAMGAEAVFDSRDDVGFSDAVMQVNQGRGVDVVLNSLSGSAMERSIACLAPFGRFVELGKRDILESTLMNLRPFLRNLSYFAYDLDQRLLSDPEGVRATMKEVNNAFTLGSLRPLPVTKYDGAAVPEAINDMQSARHVGKIVVAPARSKPRRRRQHVRGAWVIIGGTGGIGLALAAALRRAGAGDIHLISRSGALPLGAGPEGAWAKTDPDVSFHACDASDAQALAALFAKIGPLRGIVHAAMTLRDRLLKNLDAVETGIVLASKLGVAEALDFALRSEDIRPAHVLFLSSVSAYLGTPGQIAYAASNAGLDGIAQRRRKDGLAARVLGLGPVRDRGVLAKNRAKSRQISQLEGVDFLSIDQAIDSILAALKEPSSEDQLYAPLDWRALTPLLPALWDSSFDWLLTDAVRHQKTAHDLKSAIQALKWPAALKLVQSQLNEALCTILQLSFEQFDPRRPLSGYGIDSLMAMELRLEVEQRFGLPLPAAALNDTVGALDLAVMLARRMREDTE